MRKLKAYLKIDESGEVMIEAVIIFPLVLLILITMLSLGFLFYQRTMLSSVATETASAIGACYKYDQPLDKREITEDIINSLRKYRLSLQLSSMKEQNTKYGDKFLKSKVEISNLGINRSDPKIESLDIVCDDVGRFHVTVEVSIETDFLFSDILEYLNIIDSSPKFTAKSSAEIIDMTGHSSYTNFVRYLSDDFIPKDPMNIANDIYDIIQDFKKIFGLQ